MNDQKKISAHKAWLCFFAGVLLLTGLDQYTKYLAKLHLKGEPAIPLIRNILELKYLYPENRGIAFGLFQGYVPVFVVLSLVFFAVILYVLARIPKKRSYLPLEATLCLMLSGAFGNFIDRVFRGYVIDFIYIPIIDFPVFNLADVYVVVSGILLVLLVGFRYKEEDLEDILWKK